jgi:hypothetical protein
MNLDQVFTKTVDSLHHYLASTEKESNQTVESLFASYFEETKTKNEEIAKVQNRIKFLTEILELKRKINSQSASHLEHVKASCKELEEKNLKLLPETFNLPPVPELVNFQHPQFETKEKEEFLQDLADCFNNQICLTCLYKKRVGS